MLPAPELEVAVRNVIGHWPQLAQLAEFAVGRHGFGESNGGFGVTYPDDLDEYDRHVEGLSIPAGFVEVYGFWGAPEGYEMLVRESQYLTILANVLTAAGHPLEAARVRSLLALTG